MTDAEKHLLEEAEKLFDEGKKCFRKKEYDLALNILNKAVELREQIKNAEDIDEYYTYELDAYYMGRACCYDEKGDYDSAFADYTKAIELRNDPYDAYHFRAIINFYHKKDYDSAIADFTKAIESCGGFGGCKGCAKEFYMRGRAYLAKGDYCSMAKNFKTALKELLLHILKTSRYNCKMLIKKSEFKPIATSIVAINFYFYMQICSMAGK